MIIPCPWCGNRNDSEFSYGGEAHLERPKDSCSDKEWNEYILCVKILKVNIRNVGIILMDADNGLMQFAIQQQILFFKQVSLEKIILI